MSMHNDIAYEEKQQSGHSISRYPTESILRKSSRICDSKLVEDRERDAQHQQELVHMGHAHVRNDGRSCSFGKGIEDNLHSIRGKK